jgi:hypothetical protein
MFLIKCRASENDLHYYCGWIVYIKSKIFIFQNKVYITLTIPFSNKNRLSSNRISHYIF